jgi:hypothetical protein
MFAEKITGTAPAAKRSSGLRDFRDDFGPSVLTRDQNVGPSERRDV